MDFNEYMQEEKDREAWLKKHKVAGFFDSAWTVLRYRIPQWFDEKYYSVKHGFQRMFRGYDDRMLWNFYSENSRQTLSVLIWMKNNKAGSPILNDVNGFVDIPESGEFENIHKRWDAALDIMIAGFQAVLDADEIHVEKDGKYDPVETKKQYDAKMALFAKGMVLFTENYRGLWD